MKEDVHFIYFLSFPVSLLSFILLVSSPLVSSSCFFFFLFLVHVLTSPPFLIYNKSIHTYTSLSTASLIYPLPIFLPVLCPSSPPPLLLHPLYLLTVEFVVLPAGSPSELLPGWSDSPECRGDPEVNLSPSLCCSYPSSIHLSLSVASLYPSLSSPPLVSGFLLHFLCFSTLYIIWKK